MEQLTDKPIIRNSDMMKSERGQSCKGILKDNHLNSAHTCTLQGKIANTKSDPSVSSGPTARAVSQI